MLVFNQHQQHQCYIKAMSAMQYRGNDHSASVNGESHLWRNFVLGWQLPSTVQCLAHWQSGHCI